MLIKIINGESETYKEVDEVRKRIINGVFCDDMFSAIEISKSMRFTPCGEEKETNILLRVNRDAGNSDSFDDYDNCAGFQLY